MTMIKSDIVLATQTLLPIIKKDKHFEHFTQGNQKTDYFSNLISTSDFSRVMSLIHHVARKKEPMTCIFHLKQRHGLSLVTGLYGYYQDDKIYLSLYDISTLDEKHLKEITYQTFTKEELLKYV